MGKVISVIILIVVGYFAYLNYGFRYVIEDVRMDADPRMMMGSPFAEINVLAYMDLGSPSSKQLYPLLLNLMSEDMGISITIHPVANNNSYVSRKATEIALAAKQENKYMRTVSRLMSYDELTDYYIRDAADAAGLNADELEALSQTKMIQDELKQYQHQATLLNIEPPYFYINHVQMPGTNYTVDELKQIIKDIRSGRR